jgi:hypothetical protein
MESRAKPAGRADRPFKDRTPAEHLKTAAWIERDMVPRLESERHRELAHEAAERFRARAQGEQPA